MKPPLIRSARTLLLIGFGLLLVSSLSLGCNRLFRKFEEKPFNSKTWREGDAMTRGEMVKDLLGARNPLINQREEGVREQLGEPDSKVEGQLGRRKVTAWLYKIDFNVLGGMDRFLVIFDDSTRLVVHTKLGSSDDKGLE